MRQRAASGCKTAPPPPVPRQNTDCGAVIAQAIIAPMESTSQPMPWWKTVILATIAMLLSAVFTGSVAFILDHLLWE
jgi:hypothetical protein